MGNNTKRFKILRLILMVVLLVAGLMIFVKQAKDRDALYQVSVLDGLLEGDYDGKLTLREIRRHGDFGLGTFDRLDGEAIELDGIFYQVRSDGKVQRLSPELKSPFAMTTFFDADIKFSIRQEFDFRSLREFIDRHLPTKNIPFAVKIEGKFNYLKTRSVSAQNKPYIKLTEVVKNQSIFEFHDLEGTLVGFRIPDYMQGLNMPGYHLHFLSRDKTKGGHVLECTLNNGEVKIDTIGRFIMALPESADFYRLELSGNINEVLTVENSRGK